jgi:hypothetical protein
VGGRPSAAIARISRTAALPDDSIATPVVSAFSPGGRKLYRWMAAATVQ